jgi:hypothetical protein
MTTQQTKETQDMPEDNNNEPSLRFTAAVIREELESSSVHQFLEPAMIEWAMGLTDEVCERIGAIAYESDALHDTYSAAIADAARSVFASGQWAKHLNGRIHWMDALTVEQCAALTAAQQLVERLNNAVNVDIYTLEDMYWQCSGALEDIHRVFFRDVEGTR